MRKSFLILAVAFALVASVASPAAAAIKYGAGLNNATVLVPHACRVDEGYGRWSNCDQGGGGSN
jgi:hypothetical protein